MHSIPPTGIRLVGSQQFQTALWNWFISLLSRGKPACVRVGILGKVDKLFISGNHFVDEYSAPCWADIVYRLQLEQL